MNFNYYDNNKKVSSIKFQIGAKFSQLGIKNNLINSIFSKIDDGDGVISEKEYSIMQYLFKVADTSNKNTANNKIVDNNELQKVINKLVNNIINIRDLKKGKIDKINPDDYSLASIKKRYPSNKYDVTETQNGIIVYDKRAKDNVLLVRTSQNDISVTTQPYSKSEISRLYDLRSGTLQEYTVDGEKHNRIADDIYKQITAKGRFGLPTTGNNLEKYIMQINSNNVLKVMWAYKKCYGEDLDAALLGEQKVTSNPALKNRLMNHLSKLLEKAYGVNLKYQKPNTQVSNKFYKGDPYSVIANSNRIVIKNKKTGKQRVLDLNKLTKNLSLEAQIQLKSRLKDYPAEVLMDMAIELDSLKTANTFDKMLMDHTAAYYNPISDNITLGVGDQIDVESALIHEIGHAVDFNGKYVNTAITSSDDNFTKIFEQELRAYKAAGHRQSKGAGDAGCYATSNKKEMFAECYCLLMTGECDSDRDIVKYFPKTLNAAKRILAKIRSMPDNVRH